MKKQEIFEAYDRYLLTTYKKTPVIFVKGKGSILTDIDGKKYLDFFPGWGVSNVGHCHPKVVSGVRDQIGTLIHIANNYYHAQQAKLARELIRHSFDGKIFFCNSGAEAAESAIKFARAWGKGRKFEIITTLHSFHGRTMGALTATGQEKHQQGFGPLVGGFKAVPFNDIGAVRAAVTDQTAAVMIELIQGEGGINVAGRDYVAALRALCDEKGLLLIFDEVQTGFGRTGDMFAFQTYGITPDVMTIAKSFGGGLPIGAMVVKRAISDAFQPGMHGSTFAGSPLVCKAALGTFAAITKGKMLRNVKTMGPYLQKSLEGLKKKYPAVKEVRGLGLMWGMELQSDKGPAIVDECLKRGLVVNCTQGNVLRIMPVLTVTKKQIDKAVAILEKSMATVIDNK